MGMWQEFFQAMSGFADFTQIDFTALNNQWANAQNAQMHQQLQSNLQQLMSNPQFNGAYQNYRAHGGPMSQEQFAYGWMATGGYTPEGMQRWRQNEAYNQHREQVAWQGMRAAEDQRRDAQAENSAHYAHNQSIAGMNLMNQAPYATPMGPQVLPYNLRPGWYDGPNGERYFVDPFGQYFYIDPSGNPYPIQQQPNLPFH
jgi:hypothetical protein